MTGLFLAFAGLILGFQYPEAKWVFWLGAGFCLFMTLEDNPELMPFQPNEPSRPIQTHVQY